MTTVPAPAWRPAPAEEIRNISFGGCDYLAMSRHPEVLAAAREAIAGMGMSSSASRTTTGDRPAHGALERAIAPFVRRDDAVLLPEGFLANLAVCQALGTPIAIIDERAHRSLHDAAACADMEIRTYRHRDADHAREVLRSCALPASILTDAVFTADGSLAPVPDLAGILRDDDRLVLDECHALGVIGGGAGSLAHWSSVLGHAFSDPRIVLSGTLAKAIGCYGGFAAGDRAFCARVRESSSAYICTTPVPPAIAHAARTSIAIIERDSQRVRRLGDLARTVRQRLADLGLIVDAGERTPIAAFFDDRARMDDLERRLVNAGMTVPRMRYPGGPSTDYFRVSVRSDHRDAEVESLLDLVSAWARV